MSSRPRWRRPRTWLPAPARGRGSRTLASTGAASAGSSIPCQSLDPVLDVAGVDASVDQTVDQARDRRCLLTAERQQDVLLRIALSGPRPVGPLLLDRGRSVFVARNGGGDGRSAVALERGDRVPVRDQLAQEISDRVGRRPDRMPVPAADQRSAGDGDLRRAVLWLHDLTREIPGDEGDGGRIRQRSEHPSEIRQTLAVAFELACRSHREQPDPDPTAEGPDDPGIDDVDPPDLSEGEGRVRLQTGVRRKLLAKLRQEVPARVLVGGHGGRPGTVAPQSELD